MLRKTNKRKGGSGPKRVIKTLKFKSKKFLKNFKSPFRLKGNNELEIEPFAPNLVTFINNEVIFDKRVMFHNIVSIVFNERYYPKNFQVLKNPNVSFPQIISEINFDLFPALESIQFFQHKRSKQPDSGLRKSHKYTILDREREQLPNALFRLNQLKHITFARESFIGYIPSLTQLHNLVHLNLSNNYLTGEIPDPLPNTLQHLNLSLNRLVGTIPTLPPRLQLLNLDHNQLEGIIPELPLSLEVLYLTGNNLTGLLPFSNVHSEDEIRRYNLKELVVSQNQLEGSIPTFLPLGVEVLHINNNQLSGNIPLFRPLFLPSDENRPELDFEFLDNSELSFDTSTLENLSQMSHYVVIPDAFWDKFDPLPEDMQGDDAAKLEHLAELSKAADEPLMG